MWSVTPSNVSHVTREEPLQPRRVPSVFVNNTDNRAQPMEISEVEGSVHEEVKKARKVIPCIIVMTLPTIGFSTLFFCYVQKSTLDK